MAKPSLTPLIPTSRHDILGALRTLDLLILEIESGYRFDDCFAEKIIDQSKQAKSTLEKYYLQNLSEEEKKVTRNQLENS